MRYTARRGEASKRIDAVPCLARCAPGKMLVGAHVVIEQAELRQRLFESCTIRHHPLIERGLQCSKEALDAPVLPGRVALGCLVTDADGGDGDAEQAVGEDCLVVGADDAQGAVGVDRIEETAQDRRGGLGGQRRQLQTGPGSMLDQTEDSVDGTVFVGFASKLRL